MSGDRVPIEEWANELSNTFRLRASSPEAKGNQVLKARPFDLSKKKMLDRPEARWAYHDQGELPRNREGGPNRWAVQNSRMSCGKEWKANRIW